MQRYLRNIFIAFAIGLAQSAIAADAPSKNIAARVEAIPIQTLTISDQQFLQGDA